MTDDNPVASPQGRAEALAKLRERQASNRGRNHPYVFDVYIGSACLRCGLEMNHHLHCGPFGPGISREAAALLVRPPHAETDEKTDGLPGTPERAEPDAMRLQTQPDNATLALEAHRAQMHADVDPY